MTWTAPIDNLRTLLSDGPADKLRALKQVFGQQDGVNITFKTFEFRRITNFASSAISFPLGLYVNGVQQPASAVAIDDPDSGFFQAATGYPDSVNITASYYIQWFTDAELIAFMEQAAKWIGYGADYTVIPDGLQPAALQYGCHEAYKKLSMRFAENASETFRLEDSPDEKKFSVIKAYQEAAKQAFDMAKSYRDDFYSRKGQALAPRSGTVQGRIRNPTRS